MLGTSKSKSSSRNDYPINNPPEEKGEEDIIIPPGMFD